MAWESELKTAEDVARTAGDFLRDAMEHGTKVLSSAGRDIKAEADQQAENLIISALTASPYPILAEESGAHGDLSAGDTPYWVVDPLDGTLNFTRQIPFCSVSIALMHGRNPLVGVVHDFMRDECFSALATGPAAMNDREIQVSGRTDASQSIFVSGMPTYSDFSEAGLHVFLRRLQRFKKTRLLGSAALMLAYVAAGRADAYAEDAIMLWDIAAGIALVQGAGGEVLVEPNDIAPYAMNVKAATTLSLFE